MGAQGCRFDVGLFDEVVHEHVGGVVVRVQAVFVLVKVAFDETEIIIGVRPKSPNHDFEGCYGKIGKTVKKQFRKKMKLWVAKRQSKVSVYFFCQFSLSIHNEFISKKLF